MNFKVDFTKAPALASLSLVTGYILLAILLGVLAGYFVDWQLPNFKYLRAVLLVSLLILISAHFNKDTK